MVGKLTVQDCTSQVGNGAIYVNNKIACNAASDCGAESNFPCEFTETNTWQPIVAGTCSDTSDTTEADCLYKEMTSGDPITSSDANYVNKNACQAYADAADLTFDGTVSQSNRPKGCWLHTDNNNNIKTVYFNNDGSTNNMVGCAAVASSGSGNIGACIQKSSNTWTIYTNSESNCLTGGSCAAADGDVGNGATYANNKVACEAATDCGAVESTEACIWHEHQWVYGKSKPNKVVIADTDGNIEFNGDVTANALDLSTHTAASPKLTLGGETVHATADELNLFADVTASVAELNYLDIAEVGKTEPSKVVTTDASGNVLFNGNVTVEKMLKVNDGGINVDGTILTNNTIKHLNLLDDLTTENINYFNDFPVSVARLNEFNDLSTDITSEDINKLGGYTVTAEQMEHLNALGTIDYDYLDNLDNAIAITPESSATITKLEVTDTLTVNGVGMTPLTTNYHGFFKVQNDCESSGVHILLKSGDVYFCTDGTEIKLS